MSALDDYKFKIDPDTLAASVVMPTAEKILRDVSVTIANDHNGKVRAALIKLGWTPPPAPDPESAAGMHGMAIANLSARIIDALQKADWINPDVDNEDLSDACRIIADVIAARST